MGLKWNIKLTISSFYYCARWRPIIFLIVCPLSFLFLTTSTGQLQILSPARRLEVRFLKIKENKVAKCILIGNTLF